MDPGRWQKIEEVFQEVVDLPPVDRERLFSEKYAEDPELVAEVRKLVADLGDAGDFIESPVWTDSLMLGRSMQVKIRDSIGDEMKADDVSMIGKRLGVYRLTKELGRGGMGAVFLAERDDGEFRQRVAVKIIKRGMDTDFVVRRFRNERQILATLDHQYIARLLDGGTTRDGLPFFVMEYVEGRPVYRYSDEKRLSVRDRLLLFRRICSAVEYAHQSLVIHRDIKPSNILITPDGTPKLLDFGIAKILDPELASDSIDPTATAMRMMTPEYASPEQVRGEAVTKSSDIYSLGVLLYELLTGHRPYRLKNRAIHEIARVICEEEPESLSASLTGVDNLVSSPGEEPTLEFIFERRSTNREALRRELSGDLEKIVSKSLRKNPKERYASVAELSEDVQRYLENHPVKAEAFAHSRARLPVIRAARPDEISVAVLPLKLFGHAPTGETGDEFLCVGLADALITKLSNVRRLVIRPTSSVLRYGNSEIEPISAGVELGVNYVIDGSIRRVGSKLRVTIQLLNVQEGAARWAGKFDEDLTDFLTFEDSVSEQVAEAILPQLTLDERQKLRKRGTNSPEAFECYLRGRHYWNSFTEEGFAKAIESFDRALALDPNYSLAYAGIADYYNWLGIYGVVEPQEAFRKANENARKALALDPDLAEPYATLAFAQHGGSFEWSESEKNFHTALKLNPNAAETHVWYSIKLTTEGRFSEGISHAERGVELDPQTPFNQHNLGWCLYYARQFDRAIEEYRKCVAMFPHYPLAHYGLAWVLRYTGRYGEAVPSAKRAAELMNQSVFALLLQGQTLAASGDRREAEQILEELAAASGEQFVSPYHTALIHSFLENKAAALDQLERSARLSEAWLVWLGVEPAFDSLRSEARFEAVMAKTRNPIVIRAANARPAQATPTIAVLPFKMIGDADEHDTEDKFLGMGLADALITRLSNVRRLTVRPTSSVLNFTADCDPIEAGRVLRTEFVVDGNIRRVGDVLRVTIQLLCVEEGATQWARRFDEKMTDVLTLEDSISGQIAEELLSQITNEEQQQIAKRGTDNPEAWEAYLRGRYYWNQFTQESLPKALESFTRATELDPHFALAYTGLSEFYNWANIFSVLSPAESNQPARESAMKAVQLDPTLGEAYTSLGFAVTFLELDWIEGEKLFHRALELNPNFWYAHEGYATYLISVGRTEDGLAEIRRAEELNPLSTRSMTMSAWVLYQARRFSEAVRKAEQMIEMDPHYPQGYLQRGNALIELGRTEEALEDIRKAIELMPGAALAQYVLCFALVAEGRRAEAKEVITRMKDEAGTTYVKPHFLAMASIAVGEYDEAIRYFGESVDELGAWLCWLGTEAKIDPIRQDPRFAEIFRRTRNPLAEQQEITFEAPFEDGQKSIAVLPLKIMQTETGNIGENEYLGLGLADALINRLSGVKGLVVRPTSSIARFGITSDPFEAAHAVNVEFVVDGTIRRAGDRIRVSVQLLDVAEQTSVWAQSFDERFIDVLALEDSVSEQVAGALVSTLTGEEHRRIENRGTTNAKAYEAYLRGRYHWHQYTVEGLASALVNFYQAIAEDPEYAAAYSGVADYYNFLAVFGLMSPSECFAAAKDAAERAVDLDPELAEAYISLGIIAFGYDWDYAKSERYFKRAFELNPNSAEAYIWHAQLLSLQGYHDRAIRDMRRAERLNPQSVSLLLSFAIVLRNARRPEEGLAKIRRALSLQPNNPTVMQGFNWFVKPLGNTDESESMCRKAIEVSERQNLSLYAYGYTMAVAGRREEALEMLREIEVNRETQYAPPIYMVLIYTELGEYDLAFRWLAKSFDEHDFWSVFLPIDPRFDALRSDTRYEYYRSKIRPRTAGEENEDDIHQSQVSTKIFESPERTMEVIEDTADVDLKPAPAKPAGAPRLRLLVASAAGLLVLALLAFVGLRLFSDGADRPANVASVDQPLPSRPSAGARKIAVLPFKSDEQVDRENELGIGLAESLYRKLGQIRDLSVRPAMINLPQEQSPRQIGESFGVDYLIRGTLHTLGETLVVSAELVDARSERILWAETFDETMTEFPQLQVSISDKVLKALTIELTANERLQINKSYTENTEAYQLYLAGRYLMANRSAENLRKAIDTFEKARDTDPKFPLAYAGLADAWSLLNLYQVPPPKEAYGIAKQNALKALELDEKVAEAHASLGYILLYSEYRREEAIRELTRATELNPSYSQAYHWLGLAYAAMGQRDESVAAIGKAMELEPRSAIIHTAAALIHNYARRHEEALGFCRKALEINPALVPAHKSMRVIYEALGNYEGAKAAYEKERLYAGNTDPNEPGWLMITAQVQAVGGMRDDALASLKKAEAAPVVKNNLRAYADEMAIAYALIGDPDGAVRWLAKAREVRSYSLNFAAADPRYDRIRNDPRFVELTKLGE